MTDISQHHLIQLALRLPPHVYHTPEELDRLTALVAA